VLAAPPTRAMAEDRAALHYRAPSGCPSAADFTADVARRTPRARFATAGEPARTTFVVEVIRVGKTYRGRMLRMGRGPAAARSIADASCAELVSALALMMALAIDPLADTSPSPAPPPTPASRETAAPPPAAPPPAAPIPPVALPPPPPAPTAARWRLGTSAQLGARGVAPVAHLGAALDIELARDGGAALIGPALRAGAQRWARASVSGDAASASFSWTTGRLSGCPVGWRALAWLALHPCIGIEVGALHAADASGLEPEEATRLWLAWSLTGRVQLLAHELLWVETEAGVVQPLTRDRFVVAPDAEIYEPPLLSWTAALGVGARLP
jgi:hypothetical protein